MQEYNKAVEALNDPELLEQFQREQDRLSAEMQKLVVSYTPVTETLTAMNTTRNQKKRARRKARGVK